MNDNETDIHYFKEAILFLKEVQWIYNVPVTRLMVEGSLDLIPIDWLEILIELKNNELNNFVSKTKVQSNWPASLINFVDNCKHFNRLPNPSIKISPIELPKVFMKKLSKKKQHEIFYLTQLIHKQCSLQNISLIVDLGSGLGYICQLLNYLYGYKVLGLESKHQNVEAAKIRQRTLFPDSLASVKYICKEITINSAQSIESILQQEFENITKICLIGLHACGDLSVYMSKIYSEINIAQLFILVSCCYHKLTLIDIKEKTKINKQKEYFKCFPLSTTLKNAIDIINIDIGEFFRRPFMRLACQESSDKWLTMFEETHYQHSFYVLARAVLELYGVQNGLYLKKLVQKGTRKSQCSSFENYLQDFMQRYILKKKNNHNEQLTLSSIPWNNKIKIEIVTLWKNNIKKQKIVELYSALQLLLQQTAESIVLFDRLYFLKEHNYETNIIAVMNKSLSPRCYAMVSIKKN